MHRGHQAPSRPRLVRIFRSDNAPADPSCSNHAWVERLFAPLIRDGFLSSVVMDVPLSSALVRHPLVDAIHMTGGVTTHNMIVWGSPAAPAPQSPVQPLISIPVTSELGAITPWIILPAAWSDADVEHHAKYLATPNNITSFVY